MRTYYKFQQHYEKAAHETIAEPQPQNTAAENPFTRAAYEWNNALKLATGKCGGTTLPFRG